MSNFNIPADMAAGTWDLIDPGDGAAIDIALWGIVPLVSGASGETRSLARPTKLGLWQILNMQTDGGGDIVVTVAGGYNEAANTTLTFAEVGEWALLVSMRDATSTYAWRLINYDGLTGPVLDFAGITADTLSLSSTLAVTGAATLSSTLAVTGVTTFTGRADLDGNTIATTAGTGITTGTGTIYESSATKSGGVITTTILVDITGLNSSAAADVIGVDGGTANCHFGQITAAVSGTILGGKITCLEVPAGGIDDIDFYSADESSLAEDTAISAAANEVVLFAPGASWTVDMFRTMSDIPAVNQYLYLVGSGAGSDNTYTAGKFLIEFFGYDA